jgi:NADH pyrophosphatase NudC (nudix superfamily)
MNDAIIGSRYEAETPDIIKGGAIVLNEQGHLLITRVKGKDFWIFLGGTLDPGETIEHCVTREVEEELAGIKVVGDPVFYMQSPIEPAIGKPGKTVQISAFFITIEGTPTPSMEVEEIHWLTRQEFEEDKFVLGSVLHDHVIPKLIEDGYLK